MGGPDPREVARQQARLRVGDPERERAASALGEHFAHGRLDDLEYAERLDAIWSARTRADLDVLFTDLPATLQAPPSVPARPMVPTGALVAMVVLVVAAIVLRQAGLALVLAVLVFVLIKRKRSRERREAGPPLWR